MSKSNVLPLNFMGSKTEKDKEIVEIIVKGATIVTAVAGAIVAAKKNN